MARGVIGRAWRLLGLATLASVLLVAAPAGAAASPGGSLTVTATGLPSGQRPSLVLDGPSPRRVITSQHVALRGLRPGHYELADLASGATQAWRAARHHGSTSHHAGRGKHGQHKQTRNAAQPGRGRRQPGPCYSAFPDARSTTSGRTTGYNRQESVRMVLCYGFGMDPSADFPVSAGMVCGLLAQVIHLPGGQALHNLSLFADGACSGADLASDPGEPVKYIGIACSWASDLLGVLATPAAGALASLGCTLAPSIGHSLGSLFESKHEFDVAVDVVQHGKCIKYSPTHFGSPWLAVKCSPGDPGFVKLPQVVTNSGGGSGSGGGAGGSGGGGGGTKEGGGGSETGKSATKITVGEHHSCTLLATDKVACWGWNVYGQLGTGTSAGPEQCPYPGNTKTPCSTTPMPVTGIPNATKVAAGGGHTCALLTSGEVDCWGENYGGQLGDGTSTGPEVCLYEAFGSKSEVPCSTTPVTVSGLKNATSLSAGGGDTCALLASGGIDCWGVNSVGQLGDGASGHGAVDATATPTPVSGITNATAVVVGNKDTCALLGGGTIDCWGANEDGQLGDGGTESESDVPVRVSGISNAISVAVSEESVCALLASGSIDCWGADSYGDLGDGESETGEGGGTRISRVPVSVRGITNATAISSNYASVCALLASGSIECWGLNNTGQLGNGTSGYAHDSTSPMPVSGIADATQVAIGTGDACALLTTGGIDCWGSAGEGQLGDGASGTSSELEAGWDSSTPVAVTGVP